MFGGLTFNEWLVLLVVLFMVASYVIPELLREHRIRVAQQHAAAAPPRIAPKIVNALDPKITEASPDVLGYPKPSGKADKQVTPSDEFVSTYFGGSAVLDPVPVQYERKPIGACPYSKAMSADLPIANLPMCVSASPSSDMRLRA